MITLIGSILILCILGALLGFAWKLTGALFRAVLWVAVELPLALVLYVLGLLCCCTLLLIPVGKRLFRAGSALLFGF